MKTELASIRRQLETLEAFARRYPMSAALAERTHPGSIYHRDQTPDVGIVIARGWTGPNAEQALAEAGELFGRDGWTRLHHAAGSPDFHWYKEVSGVRLSLLYTETADDMPNPDGAHGSPVPSRLFGPERQPASPAAPAPATTGANHGELVWRITPIGLIVGEHPVHGSCLYTVSDGQAELSEEDTDSDFGGEGWPTPPADLIRKAQEVNA